MTTRFSGKDLADELKRLGCNSDRSIVTHEKIDSTSSDLKRRLAAGATQGTVVVADYQEMGRGRQGRSWHSPSGGNLYISLAVEGSQPARDTLPLMPLAAGGAACDAIRNTGCQEAALK